MTEAEILGWYISHYGDLSPDALPWVEQEYGEDAWMEPKIDGIWVAMFIRGNGRDFELVSRNGKDRRWSFDLPRLSVPLPCWTVVIGELEAATSAGAKAARARGYARLYAHDCLMFGGDDLRPPVSNTLQRRQVLTEIASVLGANDGRIVLMPRWQHSFREEYDRLVTAGGEGGMIKVVQPGSEDIWWRVKREVTLDYVLVSDALTDTGNKTAMLGLFIEGNLVPVMKCPIPVRYLKPAHYGHLVVEVKAFEQFPSGAAKSAQFIRVRNDKPASSCVLQATA
jgi:ATP-dependent DNA ligase